MKPQRSRQAIALFATLLFHIIFVALLFFLRIEGASRGIPQREITLIPVGAYGSGIATGGGVNKEEPSPATPITESTPSAPKKTQTTADKEFLSSDNNNPSLEEQQKRKEAELAKQKEAERIRKQQERQREIDKQMAGAFGKGTASNVQNDAGKGSGGSSSVGSGFSLAGRSIEGNGGIPIRPEGFPPTRGTVVVRIVVDSSGLVVEASTRLRGTSITNQQTIRAALDAARKTKFNSAPGVPNQEGTITYHFDIE